jgi:hypothetical protein
VGHQLLVGGHNRFARKQRARHPLEGGVDSTDDLDDDLCIRAEDLVDRIGPADRRGNPVDVFPRDIAVEDVRQANLGYFSAAQDARDRLPHCAKAQQGDA